MREFPTIDSAATVEQLRMRLKDNELEQYGEAFTPDFVYEVIRILPRFSSMRVSSAFAPQKLDIHNNSEGISRMQKSFSVSFSRVCTMSVFKLCNPSVPMAFPALQPPFLHPL